MIGFQKISPVVMCRKNRTPENRMIEAQVEAVIINYVSYHGDRKARIHFRVRMK